MPYEEEKDTLIADLGPFGEEEMGLFAEIRSYADGEAKLSVKKKVGTKGRTRQIFRISLAEAWELGKFIVANEAALVD